MKLKKRLENLERKSFYYDYITRKYVSDKNLFDEFDKIDSEFRISELEKRADKKSTCPLRIILILAISALMLLVVQLFFEISSVKSLDLRIRIKESVKTSSNSDFVIVSFLQHVFTQSETIFLIVVSSITFLLS